MLFHASPQFVRMVIVERERAAARERLVRAAADRHPAKPADSLRARLFGRSQARSTVACQPC